jgi:alpha-1,3-rhamnosyl/mannosyltransferase
VITVHDIGFLDHPEHHTPESRRHYAGQIAWALGAADVVVTHTKYVRQRIIDRLNVAPEKVAVVPAAHAAHFGDVATPADIDASLRAHGLEPGYILHVGVLEPRKNLPMLMRAHDRLRHEYGIVTPLVLVGPEGWLCQDVLDGVRHRPGAVRHLGVVAPRDLAYLYAAAAALAVPSLHEGFGLPVLEAMASGCPVVASTGGALPEVAADAAVLVDPSQAEAWAEALSLLVRDSQMARRLRDRGRARAAQFSWTRTAAGMLTLYGG